MELKLVYRALRQISEWTLDGFYSEVHVEGEENVDPDGPLIIASTHHNEIIDIATLAATIPHRRQLSFWAKSSMFANPLVRPILSSAGAIPVKRNPNTGTVSPTSSPGASAFSLPVSSPQMNLFRESSNALAAGRVIGVFPEGTSYTQPSIVQFMPGAAWAAVEYVRWTRAREEDGMKKGKELKIVPVGIVYTDKSRYLSRICVKYGTPISIKDYTEEIFKEGVDVEAASRLAVKKIMGEVERQMTEMTVNAPDWDTLYAAQMARDILWGAPANVPLQDWVDVSQTLVKVFTPPSSEVGKPLLKSVKASLTKYYALLHYTRIEHSVLDSLLPSRGLSSKKFRLLHVLRKTMQLPTALLSFVFFAPSMVLHIPAYLTGGLASRLLAAEGEEEARAQFKSIGGGIGLGLGAGAVLGVLRKMRLLDWTWAIIDREDGEIAKAKKVLGLVGAMYSSFYLLVKWHGYFVYSNYRRLKTFLTLCKLCVGLAFSKPATVSEMGWYIRPPPPPPNPFIRKRGSVLDTAEPEERRYNPQKSLRAGSLIRPLLDARAEAFASLGAYLRSTRGGDLAFLSCKGARIPL